jgi:predicted transposase YbfD/YdcC
VSLREEEPAVPAQPTSISLHFGALPDPRVERTRAHLLIDILTIGLCAILCGGEGWTDMATFGRAREGWLRTFLALPNGIPSHDTFGRVFAALDPAAFEAAFAGWVRAVAPQTAARARAVDGKTLRRSHDRARGKAALHLVSAWADASGLVLGQVAVDSKANEIVAIPHLLALLDLRGCTVTIDAMGCQVAIARQIVEQGGDYILALKDNHPTLHDDVRAIFAEARRTDFAPLAPAHHDHAGAVDKGHGRLELRRAWVISDPEIIAFLDEAGRWAGLRAIGLIEAERRVGAQREVERRHYLLSAPLDAATFAGLVRRHWGVENKLHWVLDVTFNEDASRVRAGHAAQNLAVLRRLALNLLRQDTTRTGSLATKRFTAALDQDYLTALLVAARTPHLPEKMR